MGLAKLTEKVGTIGVIASAMGCAACFPVLGTLGATLGLGFLAQFEGVFINTLLPVFACVALISTLVAWWGHRKHIRATLAIAGPLMVLATLYLFWTDSWSTYMFYGALALMFSVALWDSISPPVNTCIARAKH